MRLINTFNPFLEVKPKPKVKFKKYIPPQEHIFIVMMKANPLQHDFIREVYYSLARRREIIDLMKDDVDLPRQVLTLRTRKRTGEIRERQIRMMPPLINILLPRCETGNQYIFTNPKTGTKFF